MCSTKMEEGVVVKRRRSGWVRVVPVGEVRVPMRSRKSVRIDVMVRG